MERDKVLGVFRDSVRVEFSGGFEYCKRIIKTLMGVAKPESRLLPREAEVLMVMCTLCIDGKDYKRNKSVAEAMKEMGLEELDMNAVRNYRYLIKKKGWMAGRSFNIRLTKAITDGGLAVGIFLNRGDDG